MIARTKGKLRLYTYFYMVGRGSRVQVGMFGVVDENLVVDANGFKPLFLPFLVPVFVLSLLHFISDAGTLYGKIGNTVVEGLLVEEIFLHIGLQSLLRFLERLESRFSRAVCQEVSAHLHQVGFYLDFECRY